MLKVIYKILPLFIIQFIAKRFCEKIYIDDINCAQVFNDVLIIQRWTKEELKKAKNEARKLSEKLNWGKENK